MAGGSSGEIHELFTPLIHEHVQREGLMSTSHRLFMKPVGDDGPYKIIDVAFASNKDDK